jgi:hypothetical protein
MKTTTQEILDAAYEALNGLSIGWQMANVKDDEIRNRMQAPINAGTEALVALVNKLETTK